MNCILCNKETAFTKVGWFNQIYPLCIEHYKGVWFAYGGDLRGSFFSKGSNKEVALAFPENIIKKPYD